MALFLICCRESPVLPLSLLCLSMLCLSLLCLSLPCLSLLGFSLFCSSQPSSLVSRLSADFEAFDPSCSYHLSDSPRGSV